MTSLEAPAKLNLSLRVVGTRADGFHLLDGEMVLLGLADRLLLLPGATGLRVEATLDRAVPPGGLNISTGLDRASGLSIPEGSVDPGRLRAGRRLVGRRRRVAPRSPCFRRLRNAARR